jgi:hypothetical protein
MKRHNNNYNGKRIGGSTLIEIIINQSGDVERKYVKQELRRKGGDKWRKEGDKRRKRLNILNVFCGIHARIVVLIPVWFQWPSFVSLLFFYIYFGNMLLFL